MTKKQPEVWQKYTFTLKIQIQLEPNNIITPDKKNHAGELRNFHLMKIVQLAD